VEDSPATPGKFELLANYPNPFNPSTTIRFTLPETAPVTLQIYDNLGKLVKEIYNRELLPAKALYQVTWDGTNQNHIPVASGVYFSRLESGNKRAIRKLTLIR
jgi:flagellar hook assembly protein FlgD